MPAGTHSVPPLPPGPTAITTDLEDAATHAPGPGEGSQAGADALGHRPVDDGRAMVDEFPNASIDVIPGGGLFSQEEAPHEVAQALLPTIAGS